MRGRWVLAVLLLAGCKEARPEADAKQGPRGSRTDEAGREAAASDVFVDKMLDPAESEGNAQGDAAATRTWPADAPSPDSTCTSHEDCTVMIWDGPMPPDPCCDARVGFMAVHVAYLEFFAQYRAEHCEDVRCPPSPLPGAEPNCCVEIPRCVQGACVTACEDPSSKVPDVSRLDSSCQLHRTPAPGAEGPPK